MDLKSGRPVWLAHRKLPLTAKPLRANVACDVAVIGAGITGALVAHQLVCAGLSVVVLDKRAPVTGSTSASTALLSYETDASLFELGRRHGVAAARRVYALGRQAIDEIEQLVKTLGIDCAFARRPSLYFATDRRGAVSLKREYAARRRAGIPVHRLGRAELKKRYGLRFPLALLAPDCAQVNAVKLAAGVFAHHVRRRALRIFSHTRVKSVTPGSAWIDLRVTSGRHVRARRVVVATGYEAAPFLPDGLVALHSSYVIASEPFLPSELWLDKCIMWETARPYCYLRATADHRILIGGEDEPFADAERRDALLPRKRRALEKRFRRLFPKLKFKTEFAWTGTFGESPDGLPYIGPRGNDPRVLYALGYGGNGITFSQIAARLMAEWCVGQRPRDAALFRFDREERRGRKRRRGRGR